MLWIACCALRRANRPLQTSYRMLRPRVIVFTQQDCPPCAWVKNFLSERGILFEERSIDSSVAVARELTQTYKSQSTPTVVIGDQVLIGYDPERLGQLLAQ